MPKKILVTGGAGFLGSHLADALIERGHTVRVYDNLSPQVHPSGLPSYLNPGIEFIQGDVRDPEKLADAVSGVPVNLLVL
jgi:dTDP-L-rhamnose 4-epimerase